MRASTQSALVTASPARSARTARQCAGVAMTRRAGPLRHRPMNDSAPSAAAGTTSAGSAWRTARQCAEDFQTSATTPAKRLHLAESVCRGSCPRVNDLPTSMSATGMYALCGKTGLQYAPEWVHPLGVCRRKGRHSPLSAPVSTTRAPYARTAHPSAGAPDSRARRMSTNCLLRGERPLRLSAAVCITPVACARMAHPSVGYHRTSRVNMTTRSC